MNNGRNNYGGQQPGQPGAGYPQNGQQQGYRSPYAGYQQQPAYQQQPQQGGYPQGGYQAPQQGGYPQSGYQQAPQQGGYPQGGYQQAPQQAGYPQGGYQQAPQQAGYPQGGYQQAAQQGGYPQGGYQQAPQQGGYPQGGYAGYQQTQRVQQNGQAGYGQQPYPPQQAYGGYQQMTQGAQPRRQMTLGSVMMIVMCGVLPVLFLAALLAGIPALKIVFAVLAAVGVAALWIRPELPFNTRVTFSALYALAVVVALVSLTGAKAPADAQNQPQNPAAQQPVVSQQPNEPAPGVLEVVTPPAVSAETPAPANDSLSSDCVQRMLSFFYFWSVNNYDNMLSVTSSAWKRAQEKPNEALFQIVSNRRPVEYAALSITGTDNDASRTVTVEATVDKSNGNATSRYIYRVVMLKEDDQWFIDPNSLRSNEETKIVATNAMPTQPPTPAPASSDNDILYYNPDGGKYYHRDPNCKAIGSKFRPLTATITYGQLRTAPFNSLRRCTDCSAPLKPTN